MRQLLNVRLTEYQKIMKGVCHVFLRMANITVTYGNTIEKSKKISCKLPKAA